MSLDAATGMLTNISQSPFAAGANPVAAAPDPTSKFVFVANAGDNTLSAYTMVSEGELTPIGRFPFHGGDPASGG